MVAREAKLSARETEVFFLMAKGRGIEHIQNKLCISSHTVKSHTYNIYKKMGINSREELLDAIEAANPDDA
ncbi:response regulator transcription factor [Gordonibacter pamelaeae]|uniref:response regulator transcription factor n=1 Tax=Gordonibacter pamelaeae TaxID=471189 RepID=UPI001D0732C3|nr:helix-turn-helix transcriptional regulator [Gordonibacter pamelaeae]MCB6312511.1 helix-turn-helix transcriptional regulator [Gordonibacter pamelaeae]